ncbi:MULTISPECIES: lysozyme [unclassified Sinorhizobium]|uniref:lysozyme n=1 Tax=unclassified Sinorhizobium TaxID=2613772 RepID=UPI00352431CA
MANRLKKGTAIAAMATALVGGFEGLRQTAYPDPATKGPPWTVCYGEAKGVKPGDHYTIKQCKDMLVSSLQVYADGIERCIAVALPDRRFVALVSFAYNVGTKAACGSSVVKLINAGQTKAGCDALLKWNKAAGITFPGLTRRRQKEREYCLEGA